MISPLLANLYLHYVLDCWYLESAKPRLKGRTLLVRFADDFILGFENQADAEKVYAVLFRRFEKCGLQLHAEVRFSVYSLANFDNPSQIPAAMFLGIDGCSFD